MFHPFLVALDSHDSKHHFKVLDWRLPAAAVLRFSRRWRCCSLRYLMAVPFNIDALPRLY